MMPYVWGKDLCPGGMQINGCWLARWYHIFWSWCQIYPNDLYWIPISDPHLDWVYWFCPHKKSLSKWHTQHSTIHNFARNILNWRFMALGSFPHHLAKAANPLMFVEFESLLCSWNPGNVWWWKIKEFRTAVLCSAGPTRQRSGLELWRAAEVLYPAFVGDARHAVHHQQGGTEETWWPGLGFGFWNIWKGTPLEAPRSSKWMEKITNLSDTKWPLNDQY